MNAITVVFSEHVCRILCDKALRPAQELSGHFGRLARVACDNRAIYRACVVGGREGPRYLQYNGGYVHSPEEIDAFPKKFVQDVSMDLRDTKDMKVCREIVTRFPYAIYQLIIFTSKISESWVDFACSLKRLGVVVICRKMTQKANRLFQKFVDLRKLSRLTIKERACVDTKEMLKSALCQDQFEELQIRGFHRCWKTRVVHDLLLFWSENGEKLRGKYLNLDFVCKGGVKQLEKFIFRKLKDSDEATMEEALVQCTKEECDYIDNYYRHRQFLFHKPSCVYKYEEGEGDQRRRLYISFECADEDKRPAQLPAGHRGINDLKLMREADFVSLLFA
uniref:F-box domain-containing protein n=1 Tax=Steinernema glaseri TaxID=37863 RepID=A0A1I8AT34_9BILA